MPEKRPPTQVEIIQLSPDEWEELRDLKQHSLQEEPVALENPTTATRKYLDRTEEEWRHILSGGRSGWKEGETLMFFARKGDEYVGMVSSIIPEGSGEAIVQHMYVKGDHRSEGIGKKLINHLLDSLKARGDLERIKLEVVVTQVPAITMYRNLGFAETGMTKGAIDWTDEPLDELNMELVL